MQSQTRRISPLFLNLFEVKMNSINVVICLSLFAALCSVKGAEESFQEKQDQFENVRNNEGRQLLGGLLDTVFGLLNGLLGGIFGTRPPPGGCTTTTTTTTEAIPPCRTTPSPPTETTPTETTPTETTPTETTPTETTPTETTPTETTPTEPPTTTPPPCTPCDCTILVETLEALIDLLNENALVRGLLSLLSIDVDALVVDLEKLLEQLLNAGDNCSRGLVMVLVDGLNLGELLTNLVKGILLLVCTDGPLDNLLGTLLRDLTTALLGK